MGHTNVMFADGPQEQIKPFIIPNDKSRLVVATFDEQGVPIGMGDIVADMVIRAINAPHVELLERRQVKRVLEEQAFDTSDLTQPGNAVRYGRLVDTRFVMVGTVYRLDGVYIVSARIVDSASGIVHENARAVVQFRTVDEMSSRIAELARSLGLRQETEPSPSPVPSVVTPPNPSGPLVASPVTTPLPLATGTVREFLERVGDSAPAKVQMSLENSGHIAVVGSELRVRIQSERPGFLSLFVVDATGRVSLLLPNLRAPRLELKANESILIPQDAGFRLRILPPLGATRLKAIVTQQPLPAPTVSDAKNLLRRVELGEIVGAPVDSAGNATRVEWSSAELEFLIVPVDYSPSAAIPDVSSSKSTDFAVTQSVSVTEEVIQSALHAVLDVSRSPSANEIANLRWPLESPFQPRVDIGWTSTAVSKKPDIRIAVIDADFDPDDRILTNAFREMSPATRGELRDEIRRNGPVLYRHGNRVSSLIAGEAPWLPSVLPGAVIVPIRITTAMGAPEYRADHGGAAELLIALRAALDSECKVINLSLSVMLEGEKLRRFSIDPIWDELDKAGVVIVCAAGNMRQNLDERPLYPSCLDRPNILCVGAVGVDGKLASWMGEGSAYGLHSVDLVAPGSWLASSDGGGQVGLGSGTSYACALASGAVAQLFINNPSLQPKQAIDCLLADAKPLPGLVGWTRAGLLQWPAPKR